MSMTFENWGLIPYTEALAKQVLYVEEISEGKKSDTIVFCSHPPVVTLGRATQPDDVTTWKGDLIEVSRGGRATYHGPDQMVVYPLIDLSKRGRDLHKHLRWIESVVIQVLKEIGISGEIYPKDTGVWVDQNKICSIGIAVKKWVSYHGLSLAVDINPEAYKGINPCGYSPNIMTSIESKLGHAIDRSILIEKFSNIFSHNN